MRIPTFRLRILLAGAVLLTLVLALLRPCRADEIPCEWQGVDRVVAVGDLHGDYKNFVKILKGTGIVDDRLAWAGGKAHLVQIGDVMDRGPEAKRSASTIWRGSIEAISRTRVAQTCFEPSSDRTRA